MFLSLSYNIRSLIYEYLVFSELKSLIFLNKKIHAEILVFLHEQHLGIKQTDLFRLNKSDLFLFFKRFSNISHLQINCRKIDIIYLIPALPKKLKTLKLIDVSIETLYHEDFWNSLSLVCLDLQALSLVVLYEEKERDKNESGNHRKIKNFIKTHQSLKKLSLKFNKDDELAVYYYSIHYCDAILSAVSQIPNAIEILIFINMKQPHCFMGYDMEKYKCNNVKELKIKNQYSFPHPSFLMIGCDYNTLNSLYQLFPNLENLYIQDYFQPKSSNLNAGFQNFTTMYLNKQVSIKDEEEKKDKEKIKPITLKNFNLNCYSNLVEIDELLMINLISNCNDLRSFGSASNKFMSNGVIQELLMKNLNLSQINFDYTNIDDLACHIISNSTIVKNLTKISLQSCKRITQEGFSNLLSGCKSLKYLNVKGNRNFKNKTIDFLLQSGEIEELLLHENRINNNSIYKILKRFQKSLTVLEISKYEGYEKLTNSVFKEICEEKIKLSRLKVLDMAFNHIIDGTTIQNICYLFPNLESFNVKCCGHFNIECFNIIKESNWKYTLEKLNIKYCHLFPDQIEEILEKLKNFQILLHIIVGKDLAIQTILNNNRILCC